MKDFRKGRGRRGLNLIDLVNPVPMLVLGLIGAIAWGAIQLINWVSGTDITQNEWALIAVLIIVFGAAFAFIAAWTDHHEEWQRKLKQRFAERSKRRREEKEYIKEWRK
ncbi:MAG: hypothetical protein FWD25_03640 [Clostridia bacterium]|nr:hypothetical protein [Clostridia bacterium]